MPAYQRVTPQLFILLDINQSRVVMSGFLALNKIRGWYSGYLELNGRRAEIRDLPILIQFILEEAKQAVETNARARLSQGGQQVLVLLTSTGPVDEIIRDKK